MIKKQNLLKILFNADCLKEIAKNCKIKTAHIEMLLYSMRFCFKTLNSSNKNSLYKAILSQDNYYLNNSYFVGNDISENNYFEKYSKLKEHFENKPECGAYVCLCKEGSYQCLPSGYPTEDNKGEKCQKCNQSIGLESNFYGFNPHPVKRENYKRIFKSIEDIQKELKGNNSSKIKTMNYMTLDEFEKYIIDPAINNEKPGIVQVSFDHFKKSNKIIRKIKSQITFRLLHFILYSHLFFGKLMNSYKKKDLGNFIEVLEEDWNKLKIYLNHERMEIEIFINLIFNVLTDELTKIEEIQNIKNLLEKENLLKKLLNHPKKNMMIIRKNMMI